MRKLRSPAARLGLDLGATVRKMSREAGLGVVEALQARPAELEPAWRAERLAHGALHGAAAGLSDEELRQSLAEVVERAVEAALSAAIARSPDLEKVSEDAARAFARGALGELQAQLGTGGEGPLTRSVASSIRHVVSSGASALATPLGLLAVAAGVGLVGIFLGRRA